MPRPLSASVRRRLGQAARKAAEKAYAPYSRFPVGAAVLTASGRIFSGANVENASYSLCNCAERTALFAAVAAGERAIRAVAVFTPTPGPVSPCGACRQVINEFGPRAVILGFSRGADATETTLDRLLPDAFGPDDLRKGAKSRRRAVGGNVRASKSSSRGGGS